MPGAWLQGESKASRPGQQIVVCDNLKRGPMNNVDILHSFLRWSGEHLSRQLDGVEAGIADQSIENVAWARIRSRNTISGIKLRDTGDYYVEILPLDDVESDLAKFGSLGSDCDFSGAFSDFIEEVKRSDRRKVDRMG